MSVVHFGGFGLPGVLTGAPDAGAVKQVTLDTLKSVFAELDANGQPPNHKEIDDVLSKFVYVPLGKIPTDKKLKKPGDDAKKAALERIRAEFGALQNNKIYGKLFTGAGDAREFATKGDFHAWQELLLDWIVGDRAGNFDV